MGQRLGEYLVSSGLVYEDEVAQALADQFGLPVHLTGPRA